MTFVLKPEKLPRQILEKAVGLSNSLRIIYLALYSAGPSSAEEVAVSVGHARAYVHMRLIQLELMGLVKRRRKGRKIIFEVVNDEDSLVKR